MGDRSLRGGTVDASGGAVVARAIEAYLDEYGMRCPGEIDVTRTRWSEDPAQLVPLILTDIAQFAPGAHAELVERGLRQAAEKETSLLERLARSRRGRRKVEKTRRMISRMRHFIGYREYPKYLMMRHYWVLKQAMLREAASLARDGVIEREDDVYFLSFGEFREAVRTRHVDHSAVTKRRAEFAVFQKLTPPRIMTSDGEIVTGEYDSDTVPRGALAGMPASSGVVEGRARVVLSLDEARFEDGDILVTRFTDPSWTPAFLSVKGLVTEVGGMMTHGAVVAREYGLPAVVGVEGATTLVADGRRIRVNGTEGYVEPV